MYNFVISDNYQLFFLSSKNHPASYSLLSSALVASGKSQQVLCF